MSDDFTTARYSEILTAAKRKYHFATFADGSQSGFAALWRHDIDFSPHRALALARMESDAGVVATYFVQISSRFYNVFEPEIAEIVREIGRLGHDVGLHFETEVLGHGQAVGHEQRLVFQAAALEHVAQKPVTAFSLHNPTTMVGISFDELRHGGLINASHPKWREDFSYCSDSNGVWRFRSLDSMVADEKITRLYALTHPEWWQSEPMSPRQRLQRCVDGRKAWSENYYDALLANNDRPNVGRKEM